MSRMQIPVFAAAALVVALGGSRANAALVLELTQGVTASPGGMGSFLVSVRGAGGAGTFDIVDSFQVTLNITTVPGNPAARVTFDGPPGGVGPVANYVFPGGTGPVPLAGNATMTSFVFRGSAAAGTTQQIDDSGAGALDGELFNLGEIFFDVGPLAPIGSFFDVVVELDPLQSSFFSPLGPLPSLVPVPISNGPLDTTTIEIVAPAAVPEPSSMTLFGLCGLVGGGMAWRRRRIAKGGVDSAA